MPKRPRIGVIGSTNMDLTTTVERMPVWGETVLAAHFETSFGGKGANQAVAAAKLGSRSRHGDEYWRRYAGRQRA